MTTPHTELLIIAVLILLVGFIAGWLATCTTTLRLMTRLRDTRNERDKVVQGYAQREQEYGATIDILRTELDLWKEYAGELKDELNITLRQATAVDDAHEDALDMLRAVPVAFRADETQLLRVISEPIPEDATVAYGLAEPPRWPDSHSGLYSQVPVDPYEDALTAVMDAVDEKRARPIHLDLAQLDPAWRENSVPVSPERLTATRLDLRVPIGQRKDYPAKPLPGKKTRRKIKAGAR